MPQRLLVSDAGPELQAYLDRLTVRLVQHLDLPDGMQVRVHFSGDDIFNAFATLGGNIVLFRGLTERLPHENALAMLLAHEIAHVLHRDPIVGIGRSAAIQLVVGLLSGSPDLRVLGGAGVYTQLRFSRGWNDLPMLPRWRPCTGNTATSAVRMHCSSVCAANVNGPATRCPPSSAAIRSTGIGLQAITDTARQQVGATTDRPPLPAAARCLDAGRVSPGGQTRDRR